MEKESAPENKFCDKIWALKPFRYNIIQTPLNKVRSRLEVQSAYHRSGQLKILLMSCYFPPSSLSLLAYSSSERFSAPSFASAAISSSSEVLIVTISDISDGFFSAWTMFITAMIAIATPVMIPAKYNTEYGIPSAAVLEAVFCATIFQNPTLK